MLTMWNFKSTLIMIIKLILSQLELDLSNYEFNFIEENNWIKDNTISKYTFPVEIELTNEEDEALGSITEENLSEYATLLEAKFYVFGEMHEAVFEIESITGRNIVGQIRYGLEEFPNFNKRLSELPLFKEDLLVSIYAHAETIITQTWPAVNYNFPQVITEGIDVESEQWQYFEGIINKYVDGDFVINEFDSENNEQINRNVMIPMPYLLYVLQVGFADAGLTLTGEILNDTYYKKALCYALNEFYKSFTTQSEVFNLNADEYSSTVEYIDVLILGIIVTQTSTYGVYSKNIPLPEPGRYKIAGNVVVRTKRNFSSILRLSEGTAKFVFNGSNKWSGNVVTFGSTYKEKFYSVDFNVDYTGTEGDVVFQSTQYPIGIVNGEEDLEAMVMDVTLTQLAKFNASGELVSTLVEPTSIDLSKSVPNMTFGEFVFAALKKRNYGYDIEGGSISINKKRINAIDTQNAIDLSAFEVATPERNFNRGKTFVFKQFDFDHPDYKPQKILINNDGYLVNEFTKPDDAEEITVNAIELPLKVFGVQTAHGFLDDFSKLQLVLYAGLTNDLNVAEDPAPISHLNNYLDDYIDWFNFLKSSVNYNWIFEASYEALAELKIRSIIYAYRKYHIIRKLSRKTFLSQSKGIEIEYDIEAETLP